MSPGELRALAVELAVSSSWSIRSTAPGRPRLVEEVPGMLEAFRRVGGGAVLNNSPYDVAAAALCLTEGGAVVTDAAGRPLDPRPLLGSGPEFQISMLAAASHPLHRALVAEVDRGIARLRGLVGG